MVKLVSAPSSGPFIGTLIVFTHRLSSSTWPLMVLFPSMHTLQIKKLIGHSKKQTNQLPTLTFQKRTILGLREMRRFEGRDERSDVNGDDGNDDTGQEDGSQFVDVLHTNKDQQGHQEETDGAVDAHVVQHSCAFALGLLWFKNGRLWYDIHLKRQTEANSEPIEIYHECNESNYLCSQHGWTVKPSFREYFWSLKWNTRINSSSDATGANSYSQLYNKTKCLFFKNSLIKYNGKLMKPSSYGCIGSGNMLPALGSKFFVLLKKKQIK